MLLVLLASAASFLVTFFSVPVLIRKFSDAGITGKDVHKPKKPEIPEMGGLAVVAGLTFAVILATALMTLSRNRMIPEMGSVGANDLTEIFAALLTILIVSIIGMFDDLVRIRHSVKAILPIFASFPLIAIAAGQPYMTIPFIGQLYLPVIYPLILIPLAVTAVSNLTNMLAGFNGLEAGMGAIGCFSLGVIALAKGSMDAALLLFPMAFALLAFLLFNRYPAKIFIGDVGALSIGACIASSVIIGNFEAAGIVVMAPYLADLAFKIRNGFPREIDHTKLVGGKLVSDKAVGLPSLIMRITKGITETRLVLVLVLLETLCAAVAVLLF
jgi:UDP-N-acetylglucosamine--dolichyl-phosphate N-acetylglucosaminephosphotransferase